MWGVGLTEVGVPMTNDGRGVLEVKLDGYFVEPSAGSAGTNRMVEVLGLGRRRVSGGGVNRHDGRGRGEGDHGWEAKRAFPLVGYVENY
jgi:hypothetical protein